jgi:hypothetical protein
MAPDPDAPDAAAGGGDPVEHLWNAAHEMLRAFRTLIDAADEFVESQRGQTARGDADREPREGRVQHITIDGDFDIDETPAAGSGAGVA